MKSVRLFLLFCFVGASAFAEEPLYTVKLTSTPNFEVVSGPGLNSSISFYPRTPNLTKGKRKIVSMDYQSGIKIKTQEPDRVLQGVLRQIGEQTGLMAGYSINSTLEQIAPVRILQAYSETATITLLLTPKEEGTFILTCAHVINERPEGSTDGTPAALEQMKEMQRKLNADSVATTLPENFTVSDLKAENYFRGRQGTAISDPTGKNPQNVAFLLLKKGQNYTVGIYRESEGSWIMIDQPIALSGTGSPHIYGRGNGKEHFSSIRAVNADGKGGIDLFVGDGHVIKKEFAATPND